MKTVIFKKTLFGGFDRRDVTRYISEMSEQSAAARRDYESKAEKLSGENRQLEENNRELSEQIRRVEELSRELSIAKEELERLNGSLTADNAELKSELDSQVGKIFTQARITAQSIVHEARIKSEAMNEKSDKLMKTAKDGIDSSASAITDARDDIRALLEETAEKLDEICDGIYSGTQEKTEPVTRDDGVLRIPVRLSKRTPIARVK